MSIDWGELYRRAVAVAQHAHAPYSGLHVGAAGLVIGIDGDAAMSKEGTERVDEENHEIVVGCNVENASYGLTLCAECAMVSELHAGGYVGAGGRLVAVACVDGDGNLLTPCGRCRQLLLEAGGFGLLVNEHDHCLLYTSPSPRD